LERERNKITAAIAKLERKARPVFAKMRNDLRANAPDADAFAWPEPAEGEEDADPLFASARDYLDQVRRYTEHQGTPIDRSVRVRAQFTHTCVCCGGTFQARRKDTMTCSRRCQMLHRLGRTLEGNGGPGDHK
jgi:hypothetical protein